MTETLRHYTEKWLAMSPEQAVLSVFIPKALRLRTEAWAALHFELFECVFALQHEPVRLQKSQWWAEELQRLQNQAPRHPITQALVDADAPFAALAGPLLATAAQVPINSSNTLALMASLRPLAQALDACETTLFHGNATDNSQAISAAWLCLRMPHGLAAFDRAMLPMHLRARHGEATGDAAQAALKRDWLAEIQEQVPGSVAGNWYREAQRRFTRRRVQALQCGKVPAIQPGHAWDAWRAMRLYKPE
jgi:15-cis-phytoene synthase